MLAVTWLHQILQPSLIKQNFLFFLFFSFLSYFLKIICTYIFKKIGNKLIYIYIYIYKAKKRRVS